MHFWFGAWPQNLNYNLKNMIYIDSQFSSSDEEAPSLSAVLPVRSYSTDTEEESFASETGTASADAVPCAIEGCNAKWTGDEPAGGYKHCRQPTCDRDRDFYCDEHCGEVADRDTENVSPLRYISGNGYGTIVCTHCHAPCVRCDKLTPKADVAGAETICSDCAD